MILLEQRLFKRALKTTKAEEYNLNELYAKEPTSKGLIICYLLANEAKLITLDLEAEHEEIGIPLNWYKHYDRNNFNKSFFSLYDFLMEFNLDDFGMWHLKIMYNDVEIGIGGDKSSSIIRLTYNYDGNETFDISPLLKQVEEKSKKYK